MPAVPGTGKAVSNCTAKDPPPEVAGCAVPFVAAACHGHGKRKAYSVPQYAMKRIEKGSKSGMERLADACTHFTGRPIAFMMATAVILIWTITGPVFGFSDTWQLIINTGTSLVT